MSGRTPRVTSSNHNGPTTAINPFSLSNTMVSSSKSNSAVAAMGYTNKKSVWGVARTPILVGALKTEATGIIIDEICLMKNCTAIVPAMCNTAMQRDPPGVRDPVTQSLGKAISRADKNDVALSNAED